MSSLIYPLPPAQRSEHDRLDEARGDFLAAFMMWLHGRPTREEINAEIAATESVLRQLAALIGAAP